MNNFKYLFLLCAGLIACTKEIFIENDAVTLQQYSIYLSSESDKTALQSDAKTIHWVSGDQISVFGTDGVNYCFTTADSGAFAKFNGTASLSETNSLLYPYSAKASFKSGKIYTELPLIQQPVLNGFDSSAALCVAQYSEGTSAQMRNVFAAFRLSLSQTDVVRVDITAQGDVKIGGSVTITPGTTPSAAAGASAISMSNVDGSVIAPGTYYLLAAPAQLSSGLKVTFYYSDGGFAEKISSTVAALARNTVLNLDGVEKGLVRKYSQDESIDTYDFNKLACKAHPRLFLGNADMVGLKTALADGDNTYLTGMERQIFNFAKKNVGSYKGIAFKPYNSGLYFGDKLRLMLCMAYAYRKTGETRYLDYAVKNVIQLCEYPNWNAAESCKNKNIQSTNPEYTPTTYLNTSDLLLATSIVYDWLYYDLTEEQRDKIVSAIKTNGYAYRNTSDNDWWHYTTSNWNSVCNGALVVSALAIYTSGDTETLSVLKEHFKYNKNMIPGIYGSYGAYSEGPNYWNYGTSFQVICNTALDTALGTDLGLSNFAGFQNTPFYKLFAVANTKSDGYDTCFNYADCDFKAHPAMELWYFANKFGNRNLLFKEVENTVNPNADGDYSSFRAPMVPLYHCYKIGAFSPVDLTDKLYTAQDGLVHLVMARTGWKETEKYFGFKGGKAQTTHAHMDTGEFIYESQGVRWAIDYDHPDYSKARAELAKFGEGYFDTKQTSLRFQLMEINNRGHNTLTVNNKDHCVSGVGTFMLSYDSSSELGGKMDLTPVFFDDLQSAVRKVIIKDGSYLQVTDKIQTKSGTAAHIRFSLLTNAAVSVVSDGIVLTQDGKSVKIAVSGCTPVYKQYSTDPSSSDWPSGKTRSFEEPLNANLCGYEYDIPAGTTVSAVTTIKDL